MGNEVSGEVPLPASDAGAEGASSAAQASALLSPQPTSALASASALVSPFASAGLSPPLPDFAEKMQAGFSDSGPPKAGGAGSEPSSPSQAKLFTDKDAAPGTDSMVFYRRPAHQHQLAGQRRIEKGQPQKEPSSMSSAESTSSTSPSKKRPGARRALGDMNGRSEDVSQTPKLLSPTKRSGSLSDAGRRSDDGRKSLSANNKEEESERARLITVGSRIKSQKHFHEWLNSPDEDALKLRSPGKHYTSASRVAFVSPSRRLGVMWSEGNRFIRNNDL